MGQIVVTLQHEVHVTTHSHNLSCQDSWLMICVEDKLIKILMKVKCYVQKIEIIQK